MALPCMLIATLGAVTIVLVVIAVPTVEFSKEEQGGGGGDEDKNMSMANLLKVLKNSHFPNKLISRAMLIFSANSINTHKHEF